jgi:hypothetical protein
MTHDKTSPKPGPRSTSTKRTDDLRDFECALPFEDFLDLPKNKIEGVKPKPQPRPGGPSKMIH